MFYSSKFHTVLNTTELCSDTMKELLLLFACSYLFILFITSACRHLQANLSSASTNIELLQPLILWMELLCHL